MILSATNLTASRFAPVRAAAVSTTLRRRTATTELFKNAAPTENSLRTQPVRNPKNTIPAVNRSLDLIRVLAEGEAETHTKALALRLGIPATTCYRILCSLIGRGWVQRVADGRHILSPGLAEP